MLLQLGVVTLCRMLGAKQSYVPEDQACPQQAHEQQHVAKM
jgi:hypothetical protein